MVEKWLPVIIQLASAAFFMGIAWGEIRAIRNAQALSDERNREDHQTIFGRLDNHGERISRAEARLDIPSKGKGAHAN